MLIFELGKKRLLMGLLGGNFKKDLGLCLKNVYKNNRLNSCGKKATVND